MKPPEALEPAGPETTRPSEALDAASQSPTPAVPSETDTQQSAAEHDPDTDDVRDPVEVLADQFLTRLRRGEDVLVTEYVEGNPELADEIEDLFPTIAAMERLKVGKEQSSDGRASLGAVRLERLGDFRILREVGRGGMGLVYEAEQESLHRRVAVKVLPRQALLDSKQLRRFQREARTAASLHHTNIVPIFGVGEDDGYHYYVMQYIEGVGLDQILRRVAQLAGTEGSEPHATGDRSASPLGDQALTQISAALLRGEFCRSELPGRGTDSSESSAWTPSNGTGAPGTSELSATVAFDRQSVEVQKSPEQPTVAGPPDEPASTSAAATGVERAEPPSAETSSPQSAMESAPVPSRPSSSEDGSTVSRSTAYWRSVSRIGVQVAEAIHYAHTEGTLHRDIKPANLLLDASGHVWITDFGLAKAVQHDDISQPGDIVGTLRYMAPEQFHGQTDSRSDIYSLGLTLYEMLTWKPAFEDSGRERLIRRISQEEPARPRRLVPDVPRDLETIVLKAMHREAKDRYQSADALAEDLRRFLDDQPILARRTSSVERLWRWCRRNRALATASSTALILLLLVAVVASIGYIQTRRANDEKDQAYKSEREYRHKAETTSKLALEALDHIFHKLAPSRILSTAALTVADEQGQEYEVPTEPVLSQDVATLLESLLGFYDRLAEQQSGDEIRLREKAADANRRVADIRRRLGQYDEAEVAYQKAIATYTQLEKLHPDATEYAVELATSYNELGNVHRATRQTSAMDEAYRQALSVLEQASNGVKSTPQARYELARTYYFLGRPSWRGFGAGMFGFRPGGGPPPNRGDGRGPGKSRKPDEDRDRTDPGRREGRPGPGPGVPPGPGRGMPPSSRRSHEQYASKAIGLLEALIDEFPRVAEYRYLLALCHRDLRDVRSPNRAADHGDGSLSEATRILERLVADNPDVPDYRFELTQTYVTDYFRNARDVSTGLAANQNRLDQAITHSNRLVASYPQVPEYVASNARIHYVRGMFCRNVAKRSDDAAKASCLVQAESCLRHAVEQQATLAASYPNVSSYHVWLARFRYTLAHFLGERGKSAEALQIADSTVQDLDNLVTTQPDLWFVHGFLCEGYHVLADCYRHAGQTDQEHDAAQKAAEHWHAMMQSRTKFGGRRYGDFRHRRSEH